MTDAPLVDGRFLALRLLPGEDLVAALRRAFDASSGRAMAVVTCVGSLTRLRIRHANRDAPSLYEGHFEILSLTGTIDPGYQHLHISVADGDGRVRGGHLMPGDSAVYTTAEIVLVALTGVAFSREPCAASGYRELAIRPA